MAASSSKQFLRRKYQVKKRNYSFAKVSISIAVLI